MATVTTIPTEITNHGTEFIAFFTAQVKTPGMGRRIDEITVTRIEFRKVPGSERVATQAGLAL